DPVADGIQRFGIRHPNRAIARRNHGNGDIRSQSFPRRVGRDPRLREAIEAIRRGNPDTSFLVFVHVDDIIARQSVLRTEMIDNISMDTVKSVLHSPHPQVSVSVNQKLGYRDRGTLEILCGEGLQSAIAESLEPEVPSCGRYSDPQRAIGISN